jgi:hypothetical protein
LAKGQRSFSFNRPPEKPSNTAKYFAAIEAKPTADDDLCMLCEGEGDCEWCGGSGKFSEALKKATSGP